jgi:hypothetical protein
VTDIAAVRSARDDVQFAVGNGLVGASAGAFERNGAVQLTVQRRLGLLSGPSRLSWLCSMYGVVTAEAKTTLCRRSAPYWVK